MEGEYQINYCISEFKNYVENEYLEYQLEYRCNLFDFTDMEEFTVDFLERYSPSEISEMITEYTRDRSIEIYLSHYPSRYEGDNVYSYDDEELLSFIILYENGYHLLPI